MQVTQQKLKDNFEDVENQAGGSLLEFFSHSQQHSRFGRKQKQKQMSCVCVPDLRTPTSIVR